MEKTSLILLIILIIENLFLTLALFVYLYRTCRKCQKVKEIDRMFNKICEKCANGKEKKANGKKEQTPLF